MTEKFKINKSYLFFISLVSAFGGLLFGYDWVVIGGAKPFYEAYFGVVGQPVLQGWMMSSALVGCVIGVFTSGSMADKYGRKKLLILASILFTISAIMTGLAESVTFFVAYRILGGIGVGLASNISPMYIAEVAPSNVRGRYVSLNQMTIVLGILSAQITNMLIAEPMTDQTSIIESWNGLMGWRYMFWAETIPALCFFILMFLVPESPRWLSSMGMESQAKKIFSSIGGVEYAKKELKSIKENINKTIQPSVMSLFKGRMGHITIIGVVLAVFQQWCGINVIFNYAEEVFRSAGYSVSDMLLNIVITGVINVLFTFVAIFTVDRLGRRTLMKLGAAGLAIIYGAMGACYYFGISGFPVLLLVLAAIAIFAMTLGPITWVVLSEIFPTRVRGLAMAVSTMALWIACFFLTYTFPILNATLGASGTFWVYGIISVAGYVFITTHLPETKQKSLEQIEQEFFK